MMTITITISSPLNSFALAPRLRLTLGPRLSLSLTLSLGPRLGLRLGVGLRLGPRKVRATDTAPNA